MTDTKQLEFLNIWKLKMVERFIMKYGKSNINLEEINIKLDSIIKEKFYDPEMQLNNNYLNEIKKGKFTDVFRYIKMYKPIIGGNGVLFKQHHVQDNPICNWFASKYRLRAQAKKTRDSFEYESEEWQTYEAKQFTEKLKQNSAYGGMAYKGFIFYNPFLAQAITTLGQNAISASACGFERFMSDNLNFVASSEVYSFIYNCRKEASLNDLSGIEILEMPTKEEVVDRLLKKSSFKINNSIIENITGMVNNSSPNALKILFYKDNLNDFLKINKVRELISDSVLSIGQLLIPEMKAIEKPSDKNRVSKLWELIEKFVVYKYTVYDRIRKTRYTSKKSVLYIDTDSNFLSLADFLRNMKKNLFNNNLSEQAKFTLINIYTIILTNVSNISFGELGRSLNAEEEFVNILKMKNELYLKRILFSKAKKRYIALMVLKEGKLIKGGAGKVEIKGFDFIKANTKPNVKKFYEELSLEEILKPEEINLESIFIKMVEFEDSIKESINNHETKYYKQANVKNVSEYKLPYSQQGVKAVMLWNALCPDYQFQLPSDIDIVPVIFDKGRNKKDNPKVYDTLTYIGMSNGKRKYINNDTEVLNKFEKEYPKEFANLQREILLSSNNAVRGMGLNFIARPKNPNIPIPEWFNDMVDSSKIVNDTLSLYNPILDSLGFNIMKTSTTTSHYTNIVNL